MPPLLVHTNATGESKLPPLRLVTPTSFEVESFRNLYFQRFCEHLEPDEALFLATRYLHMFQILTDE